ncbi:apolipoprotein N-acyltransferase [Moheibacter lacus]|uniref:Apolipoprotein N-acyltransferase n=1 Tax=Moheibacter lacus TaxID=2745851 RepID=A0A838ZRY3_9FLAO|nr:apolipoprotein N-acyltransferase [Moheibacter lacus]MBA5629702.1 apolipoprotein N-acyltransferase [Moheibacter lacus]
MFRYILLAILSGLLLAFGWPSKGFPLILFVGFVPLLFIENKIAQQVDTKRKGLKLFGLSYLAFFIWNAIGIWWLHYAQELNSDGQWQNSWTAYLFPVFANSLLMSLVFQLYHWVKSKAGNFYGIPFFPVIWMSFEKFHLNWEMTWPWFNLGNGFANFPKWVQWYEFTGTFGGTLWILVGNLIIFYYLYGFLNLKEKKFRNKLILFTVLWIGIPIGISYWIYNSYEEKGEEITAMVLQPELNPYTEKYNKSSFEIVNELIQMTHQNMQPKVDFVVAPETAFPGSGPGLNIDKLEADYLLQQFQSNFIRYPEMTFVSGVELMRFYPYEKFATKTASRFGNTDMLYDVTNSAIQLNQKDSIQYYHKSKLVVGVEHFPYMSILKPILGDLMMNFGGTVRTHLTQEQRTVFKNSFNNAVVAPIICYESIYGDFTTGYVRNGANILFIMTNDSWWGDSDGHRELLLFGNLRAIENRRDIVRSANSGISGFINQKGEITSSLAYEKQGALIGKAQLNNELTFYSKHGDYLARIALLIAGILIGYTVAMQILNWQKKKNKI